MQGTDGLLDEMDLKLREVEAENKVSDNSAPPQTIPQPLRSFLGGELEDTDG